MISCQNRLTLHASSHRITLPSATSDIHFHLCWLQTSQNISAHILHNQNLVVRRRVVPAPTSLHVDRTYSSSISGERVANRWERQNIPSAISHPDHR